MKRAEQEQWKAWNLSNGLESIVTALAESAIDSGVKIQKNMGITRIEKKGKTMILNGEHTCDHLISSISPKILSNRARKKLTMNYNSSN